MKLSPAGKIKFDTKMFFDALIFRPGQYYFISHVLVDLRPVVIEDFIDI